MSRIQTALVGFLAAGVVGGIVGAGCGGAPPAGERRLVVGFSQVGAESAWRTAMSESMREEARNRGIDLRFSDAQQRQENQIRAVRNFIAQRVDVIVLAPIVETGWEPVLREAKQAGIPVILADRSIIASDPELYVTLIGNDFVEEGRRAGRALAEALDGKGNVVELQGTPGSAPANDRKRGFEEVIRDFPEIRVIRSQTGEFTRAKGKEVMEAFLKAEGRNINALFAHNDDMALGAIQAIEEAGIRPGQEIIIVSVDAVRGAFDAIIEGKLNVTVECKPLLGPAVFDAVEQLLRGEELPKLIPITGEVFTAANAAEALPARRY